MMRKRSRRVPLFGLVVALIVTKGLLFVVLLPPWQGPDEPTRLEPVVIIAAGDRFIPELAPQRRYQEETLRSMRLFRAWDFYERDVPPPEVKQFEGANLPAGSSLLYEPALAYLPMGLAARWTGARSVLGMLYSARAASLLLHVLATGVVVWIVGRVFRNGASTAVLPAAALMYSLHPQATFLTSSVHPDALGFLLSALVLALLILVSERSCRSGRALEWIGPFVLAVVLSGISAYVIRKLLILVPFVISALPVALGLRFGRARSVESAARVVLACLLVGFLFCVAMYEYPETVGWRLLEYPRLAGLGDLAAVGLWSWLRYAAILFTTFWLALGSLVNKLSPGWLLSLAVFLAWVVRGWVKNAVRLSRERIIEVVPNPRALGILILWLGWVTASVLAAYGPHVPNPEGRYLLIALPSIVVLWIGGLLATDSKQALDGVRLWVGFVIVLNAVVFFHYLIPIYYLRP